MLVPGCAGTPCRLTIRIPSFVSLNFVFRDPEVAMAFHSVWDFTFCGIASRGRAFSHVSCPGFQTLPQVCAVSWPEPGILSRGRRQWRKRRGFGGLFQLADQEDVKMPISATCG